MRRKIHSFFENRELRPFFSILIIIGALFTAAFFKITQRRLSYALYRESRKFDHTQDEYHSLLKTYSKLTQPARLKNLAEKRDLREKQKGQVIQVIDGKALIVE